jgi:hypothetical protein
VIEDLRRDHEFIGAGVFDERVQVLADPVG